jgi:parallel beta-helix repeat protein
MRFQPRERWSNRSHRRVAAALLAGTTFISGHLLRANAQAANVTLSPGANIQSAVNANPDGTTFILQPGVYRMQAVVPKTGDTFTGQTGADLNGSQVLNNWVHNGAYWTNMGAPALDTPWGPPSTTCNDPTTGCAYPQDLYLNNVPLVHKLAPPITSGQWYFDYTNDVIYMADNPNGQKVELSVAQQAFSGHVDNVTVQNLIVEKYAAPILLGAISPYGSNWVIKSNEVRLNHSGGIKPAYKQDNNEQILNNNVHDNGQEGIGVGGGTGTLVEYNTIANNGYANVLDGTENGGGKIAGTTNAKVLNNTYINNSGVGLWADMGATGTVFSGNTVTGNRLDGIRYEISHYGTISNNTLTNNAQDANGACTKYNEEIAITDSDHTAVTNNVIKSNCAGIQMQQGIRNLIAYDSVTHNTLTLGSSVVVPNRMGGKDAQVPTTLYDPANHNYFDYNTYHFTSPGTAKLTNWIWADSSGSTIQLSWAGWRADGQDSNGSAD